MFLTHRRKLPGSLTMCSASGNRAAAFGDLIHAACACDGAPSCEPSVQQHRCKANWPAPSGQVLHWIAVRRAWAEAIQYRSANMGRRVSRSDPAVFLHSSGLPLPAAMRSNAAAAGTRLLDERLSYATSLCVVAPTGGITLTGPIRWSTCSRPKPAFTSQSCSSSGFASPPFAERLRLPLRTERALAVR